MLYAVSRGGVLIFLGPEKAQPGLFSIGTWGRTRPEGPPPLAVDIESGKHSLRDVLSGSEPTQQMQVACGDWLRRQPIFILEVKRRCELRQNAFLLAPYTLHTNCAFSKITFFSLPNNKQII